MDRETIESPKAKTKVFSAFALSNLSAMRLLHEYGLLGKTGNALGALQGKEKSYRNIAEHSLVVGMVADIILERLYEKKHISYPQWKQGTKAALMHDLLSERI